jgi:hypothetical protein
MPVDKSFLFTFLKLIFKTYYLVQGEPVDLSEGVEPQVPLPVHSGEIRLLTVQRVHHVDIAEDLMDQLIDTK